MTFDPKRHCGSHKKRCAHDLPWKRCPEHDHPTAGCLLPEHRCMMWKGQGTAHPRRARCWLHGGGTPNGKKHAQTEAAEQAVAKLGIPSGNGSPFTLLTKAIRHAEGYLEASAVVLVEVVDAKRTDVDLAAAVAAYVRGIREAARTAKTAVDADVADRLAAVDEQMGAIIHRVLSAALDAAGVSGARRAAAEDAIVRELLAVGPAGAERN